MSATLFVPGTDGLLPESRCGIERAPQGVQSIVVAWGDSFGRIVVGAGATREEAGKVRWAIRKHHNLNKMGVGDMIDLHVRADGAISWFRFRPHLTTAICAKRNLRDEFIVRREELESSTETAMVEAKVNGRLTTSFEAVGEEASLGILVEDLFPHDIIRSDSDKNARLRVLVERRTIEGRLLDYGRILAAEYRADHKRMRVFHYVGASGVGGYYDGDGNPQRSTRLRSPVPGAPIASGYGYRKHPIRRRRRMHRGVDYSAARGAAVSAAADGVIISAQREGQLGKTVAIRHSDGLVTHYAHLVGFAKTAIRNRRIRQGQVIGYVGSTGLSTGAHLHFETLVDGKHMDPLRLSASQAPTLQEAELEDFHQAIQRLLTELDPMGQVGSGV